jgi:hypothetical protein
MSKVATGLHMEKLQKSIVSAALQDFENKGLDRANIPKQVDSYMPAAPYWQDFEALSHRFSSQKVGLALRESFHIVG